MLHFGVPGQSRQWMKADMQWQPLCAVCVIERLPAGNISFFMGMPYSISLHLKRGMNVPWCTWHFPWVMHAWLYVCACTSLLRKEHGDAPGHVCSVWNSTLNHIKVCEVKRKDMIAQKHAKYFFCGALKKKCFRFSWKWVQGSTFDGCINPPTPLV